MMIPKKREISGKNIYLSELIIHPAMLSLSAEFLLGDGNVRAFFAVFDQLKVGGTETCPEPDEGQTFMMPLLLGSLVISILQRNPITAKRFNRNSRDTHQI
jgi:hypothetical protein